MKFNLECIVGQPEWDFVVSCFQFICAALGVSAYVFMVAPLTTVIIEGQALRYKIQGYSIAIIQMLLSRVFERAFVIEILTPETVDPSENAIVLSNHQGFLDYLTLQHVSDKLGIDQSCFFYVWKHCVRLPSWRTLWSEWQKHADWLVPYRNLEETFTPILDTPYRGRGGKWIVLYPEVMPWNLPDMLQHRAECTGRGGHPLNHLLYPRFPAFVQTVTYLRDLPIGAVYDVTITYMNRRDRNRFSIPTWFEIFLSNKDWKIRIKISRTIMYSLPKREKPLVTWLEKLWYAKDKLLGEFMQASEASCPAKRRNKASYET